MFKRIDWEKLEISAIMIGSASLACFLILFLFLLHWSVPLIITLAICITYFVIK